VRALLVGLVLGLFGFLAMGLATSDARRADVDEAHTVIAPTSLGELTPIGSVVRLECEEPDGASYLAVGAPSGITLRVLTVRAAQLDSPPRGPFTESCAHWLRRHHVGTVS
jgi:hypothetical protein